MDNQEKQKEDQLKQYIDPEGIEKAPEGFTVNVMTRIQMETVTMKVAGRLRNKSLIPVISVSLTVLLIVAALLIPGSETGSSLLPAANLIKDIKISLPEINLTSIFRFNLPYQIIYVFIGVFVLTLLDRALYFAFHREK
jgi:hypothetical protein